MIHNIVVNADIYLNISAQSYFVDGSHVIDIHG